MNAVTRAFCFWCMCEGPGRTCADHRLEHGGSEERFQVLTRLVQDAVPHEPGCCAGGCTADRAPCCGSERCRCPHERTVGAVLHAVLRWADAGA